MSHNERYLASNFYPHTTYVCDLRYLSVLRSCIVDSTLVYVTLLRGCDIVLQAHFHLPVIMLTILTSYSSMWYLYCCTYIVYCTLYSTTFLFMPLLTQYRNYSWISIFSENFIFFGTHSLWIDIFFWQHWLLILHLPYITLFFSFLTFSFMHSSIILVHFSHDTYPSECDADICMIPHMPHLMYP